MHPLERTARLCDSLNEVIGRTVSWLTLLMVLVTFAVVVLRYLFDLGWIALQESVTYMHGAVFMLGAAYTLRHDGHVRVDIFYRRLGPRGRAWVDLGGSLLLLFPFCLFIGWTSWDYVANSWALREGSAQTGGLRGVFLLKSAILLLVVLLFIQGIAQAARSILVLRGHFEAGPDRDAAKEL